MALITKPGQRVAPISDQAENPRAVAGNNAPPEPTPFESVEKKIVDLYDEAVLWLDGDKVTSQELADGVTNLKNMILKAKQLAEAEKATEKRPHLDANTAIEARYKALIAKAELAMDACKKAVTPWLIAVQAEIDRKAAEARKAADDARFAAQQALRDSDRTNLTDRGMVEDMLTAAKRAEQDAARAAKAIPLSGGGVGRRVGLTTIYTAELVNSTIALKHFCVVNPAAVREFVQRLADAHVRIGAHTEDEIPGFKIKSEQVVR